MKDVYLFSGFLGSGKTSMLGHVIGEMKARGLKPAVIMNELGKLNFDSQAVDEDIPLKEMLEGCICCSGSEKTEAQIQSLLHGAEFDALIIETTGAAHPVEALDAVYSPLFAEKLNVKGIITVTDSNLWLNKQTLSPQARMLFIEQIRHAHVILINKIDLISDQEAAQVTMEIQALNPKAFILQTTNGKVPFSVLENMQATVRISKDDINSVKIGGDFALSSQLIEFDRSFKQDEFEDWVRSLPESVYRMKGYVPIEGIKNPMLFQYAYGMVQWMPEYVQMPPKLVMIGEHLKEVTVIS